MKQTSKVKEKKAKTRKKAEAAQVVGKEAQLTNGSCC